MYKNYSEEPDLSIEELATDEQKQQAASVAIDSYDKSGTYIEELRKLVYESYTRK